MEAFTFCSMQTFNGLDDVHPHCRGKTIPSLPTQMLISPGNTHRHTQKCQSGHSWPSQIYTKKYHADYKLNILGTKVWKLFYEDPWTEGNPSFLLLCNDHGTKVPDYDRETKSSSLMIVEGMNAPTSQMEASTSRALLAPPATIRSTESLCQWYSPSQFLSSHLPMHKNYTN